MVTVQVGAATDTGRIRRANEDRALTAAGVFAVADGMGGHAAGGVASELAVAALERLGARPGRGPQDVRDEIARANRDILAAAVDDLTRTGMGTTVAGVTLVQVAGTEHWVVFNVGDSRVYRYAESSLTQITVDHAEAEGVVRRGGVITRALGTDPGPEADLWMFPPTSGERFLICSDGLPLELADGEIAAVLRAEPAAQAAADRLVRCAVDAGGRDNVTAVVIDHLAEEDLDEVAHTIPPRNRS
jgi:protein phosphatase